MTPTSEEIFWMGGVCARNVIATITDPRELDDGFWAVQIDFEGKFSAFKFAAVSNEKWPMRYEPLGKLNWISSHSENEYVGLVERARSEIALGNFYQVNACRQLSAKSAESLAGVVQGFIESNPVSRIAFLRAGDTEIASASPETFLERDGQMLKTSPIKGTRTPAGAEPFSEKDVAENLMIVDLMRNDLSQICDDVHVSEFLTIAELPNLDHLISTVEGELRNGVCWDEIFRALLPAGSIVGAPKSSAIRFIEEHEGVERGPYCGILGWIHGERAVLSVAIRIFWRDADLIHCGTGAGITWGSEAQQEWRETELKVGRLLSIVEGVPRDA